MQASQITPQQGLVITGLEMAFEKTVALANLSAVFPAGEITGVVGPDGAGKTTLLRIIAQLMVPDKGEVLFNGKSIDTKFLGYMPQHFGLYEDLTVIANMRFQAALRGVEGKTREKLFKQLLSFTSLGPFQDRLAGRLSGGMKQKLGIACALLGSPKLLLLDEPGVGVDPQSRRELWAMVQDLRQSGMTILWSTSYMDEAQRCPFIIILDHGKSLFQGKPQEIMQTVKDDVYLIPQKEESQSSGKTNRTALLEWSEKDYIEDALIQGNALRITVSPKTSALDLEQIKKANGYHVPPMLEDAYMTLIGGINHAPSPLVNLSKNFTRDDNPKIVAENLTKEFGSFVAASNVSLQVRQGEIFGLLGPNGAGKTTTFRMLCGLLKPTSGKCYVDGVNLLRSGSLARSRLGYMAQKFSLYVDISVQENILIFGGLYGLSFSECKKLATPLLEALELEPFLKNRTGSLPLGMKQRLSLLCAILHNPPVIFLDEPTSGVDVRTRRDFWKHISALTANGASVLVTTHFMEEAEYCDHIALLYRGTVINSGTPFQLRESVTDKKNPTLEDAFIEKIQDYEQSHPISS